MESSGCYSTNPFVTLSDEERELVCKIGAEQKLSPGQMIFREGYLAEAVYYIKTGHVKIYRNSFTGKISMVGLRKAGDLIGVCEVLAGMARLSYAEALGAVQLVRIEAARFMELMSTQIGLAVKVATALGNRLREAESLASNMASVEIDRRLSRLLIHLANYGEATGSGIRMLAPLTHQDLATMIGSCRQTVTSTLQGFKDMGILRTGKRSMEILDMARLKEISET